MRDRLRAIQCPVDAVNEWVDGLLLALGEDVGEGVFRINKTQMDFELNLG